MYWKKVPLELWGLAIQCASYVQNRAISSTAKVTPFERWYGREPDVSHLRTFGSLAFAHVPDEKRKKLDPKATEGIMVGYGDSSRVYKIWDPVSRTIITMMLFLKRHSISRAQLCLKSWITTHSFHCHRMKRW